MRQRSHGYRRLRLTPSGGWYLALTVGMGVVALVSGNNVLYLIESLLLSGLILSGVLSERAISAVRVEVVRRHAVAGQASRDTVRVTNLRRFPVFCVEVGEWRDGEFLPVAWIPRLGPGEKLSLPSRQRFGPRGTHRWEALAVATSYPFGFARKSRLIPDSGERLVWPAPADGGAKEGDARSPRQNRAGSAEVVEGEIRPYTTDDDLRLVVWAQSARHGIPMVRVRRTPESRFEVTLDLRAEDGAEFERRVSAAATPFHRLHSEEGSLRLLGGTGPARVTGRRRILDRLALIRPEGPAARRGA